MENRIAEFRTAKGWSRQRLADGMGTSAQQVEKLEKGHRRLTVDWMHRAATALGVSPQDLLPNARPESNAVRVNLEGSSLERLPHDLPIMGTALGAPKMYDGAAIEQTMLNQGDIIGYAKRPVILNGRADAYALYIVGSSMDPVYPEGWMIVAEGKRAPRVGDDVVIYLRANGSDDESDDGSRARAVMVKRLVRRTASYLEVQQFSPACTFRIDAADVVKLDRVLTLPDLIQ